MTTRAERRRAEREALPAIVVAVTSESGPRHSNEADAIAGARFSLRYLLTEEEAGAVDLEWEWLQGPHALARLAGLVRANPPVRLRRHYRRLREDLTRIPEGYIGFVTVRR